MTLSLSENIWVKAGFTAALAVALIAAWAYLSGGIFLLRTGQHYEDATPLTIYQYWYYYGAQKHIQELLYTSIGLGFAALLLPFGLIFGPTKKSLFGDARFAKKSEVKKAGLLGEKGLIVGKLGSRFLMFEGQQHAIIAAPTRSGKGVGIVIPNLLNWPDSVVVLDIKQENWSITSGYRNKYGQQCYLFNPAATDYRTHRYNPLAYISDDTNFRIDDIQKIANMRYPDKPDTDLIWTATPRSLFLGIVLYLLETPGKPVTMGQVLRESLADGDGAVYFAKIINDRADEGKPLSGACVRALNTYISISADNTRSGVIAGFRSGLEQWMNPMVDAATSANDFDLRDVRKKRMSIYLGITVDNLERMAPILNLFFQQLIDLNTRELPSQNKALKHQCLLLADEFTAIGKINVLSKGISYIAGYGLRMMPIIQSPAQLFEVYGKHAAENFTTNHALMIVYPPKASETQTAKDISEWLGYQTVEGRSESRRTPDKYLFSKSVSVSEQRRALLLPQEITALGGKKEIVVMEDTPPILAKKVVFFKETAFIDRLKELSPSLRALGSKLPTKKQMDAATDAGELSAPVPLIDLAAHHRTVDIKEALTVIPPQQGGNSTTTIERDVLPDDLPNLAKLGLASFVVDFSDVKKPTPGDLDVTALNAYADNLCRQAGIER